MSGIDLQRAVGPVPADLLRDIRRVRRELHQIPEVMFQEHQTAQYLRGELTRLGIPFTADISGAPTATIAHLGDPARACVALRADIDALPIEEQTGVEYASKNPGAMHACGHDGHMACLLGAAAVLKRLEGDLPVSVKLIFQPAEEGGGGAEKLCNAGVLDGRVGQAPCRVFGLHGWPSLPLGAISTRPGALLAATDNFAARFVGRGCHGAYPHLGRDPIVAAAEGILALQQIVSREVDPTDAAVVSVGMISGGTAVNIIPEHASFEGTARTLRPETRTLVKNAIRRRLEGVAAAHDVRLEFEWVEGYPATINDPDAAQYVRDVVTRTFGPDAFLPAAAASMGGEDFAYYLEKLPGCFVFLGTRPDGAEDYPGLHHPLYNFNDDALDTGIRLLVALAVNHQAS